MSATIIAAGLLSACGKDSTGSSGSEPSPTASVADATQVGTTQPDASQPEATTAGSLPAQTDGSTPPMGSEQIDPGLQPYIDIAVADLAKRLSIDAGGIAVSSATLVEWPDSSLGCPQPGMAYAQSITDGARIVLNAGGKQYRYHSGGSRTPFLCEQPANAPPTSG